MERLLKIAQEGVFAADDLLLCFDRDGELVTWKKHLASFGVRSCEGIVLEIVFVSFLRKGCSGFKPIFPHSVVAIYGLRFTEGCQFAKDLEFWCYLFRVGLKLRILLEPLYFLRLTPHSLTAKANMLRNFSHYLGVFDRLLAQQGFSVEEKRLLEHYCRKAEKKRYYLLLCISLKSTVSVKRFVI